MTENEWLDCSDPIPMLEFLRGKTSDRKLRLFACACCILSCCERSEIAELFAIGKVTVRQLGDEVKRAACEADALVAARTTAQAAATQRGHDAAPASEQAARERWVAEQKEKSNQAILLREIVGNPFRCSVIDPCWLTWNDCTIPKLAQAIDDEHAFDTLPILADALEEAGCDNADILNHLRGPGPHLRYCWAVDLLLGKEAVGSDFMSVKQVDSPRPVSVMHRLPVNQVASNRPDPVMQDEIGKMVNLPIPQKEETNGYKIPSVLTLIAIAVLSFVGHGIKNARNEEQSKLHLAYMMRKSEEEKAWKEASAAAAKERVKQFKKEASERSEMLLQAMKDNAKLNHPKSILELLREIDEKMQAKKAMDRKGENKNEDDKAIEHYSEAIRLNPRDPDAYCNRGGAYVFKKEYDKAISDYSEAIRLNPRHVVAYCGRGGTYIIKNENDKAIEDFSEAIRINPKIVIAYHGRGIAYDNKNHYDKAIEDFSEAIRLDPEPRIGLAEPGHRLPNQE